MEEDIKILEDFIKYFEAEAISIKYRRNISITVGEDDIQALENLIKGYKFEKMKNVLDEQSLKEALDEYIPKSKIREKIDEWDKSIKWNNADDHYYAIKILQELMEDK